MTILYIILLGLCLLSYSLYVQTSRTTWSEREIRELERMELHLGQIVRLLEVPDVQMLMERLKSRKTIFVEFSKNLREDVETLLRLGKLRSTGFFYVALFYLAYSLLTFKARFFCHRNDLRFLAGLAWSAFLSCHHHRI